MNYFTQIYVLLNNQFRIHCKINEISTSIHKLSFRWKILLINIAFHCLSSVVVQIVINEILNP